MMAIKAQEYFGGQVGRGAEAHRECIHNAVSDLLAANHTDYKLAQ